MSTVEISSKERLYHAIPAQTLEYLPVSVGMADEKVMMLQNRLENCDHWRRWHKLHINLLKVQWALRGLINNRTKRAFDIVVSIAAMPFLLPILALVAVAIKLDSEGPVFFLQKRVGKYGKTFYCYKFRSMYKDADARKAELMQFNEAKGVVFKMKNDPRVTRVGKLLRKTSLDELPQIINVLKGDMSLVGPRPPVPSEVQVYKFEYLRRLEAMPGITGLQQVVARTGLEFDRWVELDVEYIQQASLHKDIEILAKTIPAVITQRGAY